MQAWGGVSRQRESFLHLNRKMSKSVASVRSNKTTSYHSDSINAKTIKAHFVPINDIKILLFVNLSLIITSNN